MKALGADGRGPASLIAPQAAGDELGQIPPGDPLGQDSRWAAVLARDRTADGRFWYSVTTTGVYCRPSCAARRPNPKNVRFHASVAEAEAAGFRPCKRCHPERQGSSGRWGTEITAACRALEEVESPPTSSELAASAGLSPGHFRRLFEAATGVSPKTYASAARARRMRDRLSTSDSVTQAIYEAGFETSSRFYAASYEILGMTPRAWRAGGEGIEIRFAVGGSSLGSILVAMTELGVCALSLGSEPDALVRELQDRFPRARLLGADPGFEDLVARAVGFVDAPAQGLDLPLDVAGSAFQHRVWQALRRIPLGETTTYTEVARGIGAPTAARAVAQACAANPVALAIPCHRVVRTDGGLSGYRWGVERKQTLLQREAAARTEIVE